MSFNGTAPGGRGIRRAMDAGLQKHEASMGPHRGGAEYMSLHASNYRSRHASMGPHRGGAEYGRRKKEARPNRLASMGPHRGGAEYEGVTQQSFAPRVCFNGTAPGGRGILPQSQTRVRRVVRIVLASMH